MNFWLLLLLGIFTYLIVQRSVTRITRTPVWILWLVLMTPAFIWSAWTASAGSNQSIPLPLVIGPFIICPILYWLLIQWGRRDANSASAPPNESSEIKPAIAQKAEPTPPVRPIDSSEEKQLRDCFPWSIFYIHNIEYRPQAVICYGQLRTTPTAAYQRIKENIQAQFGDRFQLILQEGLNGKPFFALVPNPQARANRAQQKLTRPVLALGLLLATLLTTTIVGVEIAGANITTLSSDPSVLLQGLPYSLALMTILGIHELGHYSAARYYKIRATLPYFIPVPFFLGTFGAFIQMRSPVPNRKALFDVSIAGPLAGFIATIPFLVWGLANSTIVPLPEQPSLFDPSALNPNYSLLLALLSKLMLGAQLTANTAINLHPVAFAGFLGLVVTALNLMPVGQLDGGHIVHAMFGQRRAIVVSQIARFLVLALALLQPGFLLWAIILFFMPIYDEPALNDVTELDNLRDFFGLLALAVLVVIVLPVPNAIAQLLQIG
ncbi:site-2 protease family protein [Chroogloeocystis siderophila]|jgi:membrane-associated protease RseP (regulator of RpoE activity)|uniref:Site-2 protease family protein n=1 Tax=Chroogloeocystis siderophila 5.2 s.c.1 TaxID=247279 RepID=A0A1U7HVT5_9CHRO|nr:site-2 protease family protein [Chroogloeocystis siderophila]OKH27718.1 site-2 protease family protein [Chroogloeocystis siderophila 5.2 s.c.1]